MACACGKPDQGYGAVSYLDNYGVNASSYGLEPIVLAAIIGASATTLGVGGGLLGSRSARKQQEEAIEAERIAQEKALVLERQKMVLRQKLFFWTGVLGISVGAAILIARRQD